MALALALVGQAPAGAAVAVGEAADGCLACHGEADAAKPVDAKALAGSRHAALGCAGCHSDMAEYPHPERVSRVDCESCHGAEAEKLRAGVHSSALAKRNACVSCHGSHAVGSPRALGVGLCARCHQGPAREYARGVHGRARAGGDADAAACFSCHGGGHAIKKVSDPESTVYPLNLPETCAKCHADAELARRHGIRRSDMYKLYIESTHGRAAKRSGLLVSANCSSCHDRHAILSPRDPGSTVYRANIHKTCGKCHAGIQQVFDKSVHGASKTGKAAVCIDCHKSHEIGRIERGAWRMGLVDECGSCHQKLLSEYRHTYHGKVTRLGYVQTAKCSDCHGSHDVQPASHPASSVNPANKPAVCAKCHPGATASFASYIAHPDDRDRRRFPTLYWVASAFKWLLLATFLFWGLHTFLWAVRATLEELPARRRARPAEERSYWRFALWHRVMHIFVIVSFLGLAATGLPLKFSDQPWAVWLSHLGGGFRVAAWLHRLCALITFGYGAAHLAFLFRTFVARRDWSFLWGKDSLMPQPADLAELWAHLRYFVGLAPRPRFGRWTYWEKFDYWAVFWGIAIIGSTGLLLWFPVFFASLLPGWMINVATIVHSDEALLAVGFIFTVHFFNTHLRPGKFPIDEVIFTGRLSESEFERDKPGQYEELRASGKLARLEAPPPSLELKLAARMFGFAAVLVGLFLIICAIFWH